MIKAVIYARVSSKEQEETGYSLPAQEGLLNDYGARKSFSINKVFSIAESASGAKQRKYFTEMMEYLRKKNINILLCEKVDRITRNLKEAVVINDWLEEDEKREIHFIKQNLIIHKNSKSDEKFRWDIEIVLAKKFIANLSEEVRKGQAQKLKEGGYPSRALLGYKTVGEKGRKIHAIDERVAPFIKKMFELYSGGLHSLKTVTDLLYKEGLRNFSGKKVHKSMVAKILSNPFYCGGIKWNGVVYKGNHEPIITKELYDRVQLLLTSKNTPKYGKHAHLFKQMGKCGQCNGTATGEIQKGHVYYHCNGYKGCTDRKYVREEDIEFKIADVFTYMAIGMDTEELEIVRDVLKEDHKEEVAYLENALKGLDTQFRLLQQRLDKAYTDKLDGKITDEQWQRRSNDWRKEQEDILTDKTRLQQNNAHYMTLGISFIDLAKRAREIYNGLENDVEAKREFLKLVLSNFELNAEKIAVFFTKPIVAIKYRLELASKTFEPTKNPSVNGASGVIYDSTIKPMIPSANKNFEPKETLIFSNDLGGLTSKSRELLRRQDSNLEPSP